MEKEAEEEARIEQQRLAELESSVTETNSEKSTFKAQFDKTVTETTSEKSTFKA